VTSKIGLTIFLIGIAVGRLLLGYITKPEHILRNLIGMFFISSIIYSILYLIDLGRMTYTIIFLAGLGISAILPLIISLAGLMFSESAGMVVGTIKIALPLGGILIPLIISITASRFSFQYALIIFPVLFLLGTFLLLYGLRDKYSR
jgi:MFS family permease